MTNDKDEIQGNIDFCKRLFENVVELKEPECFFVIFDYYIFKVINLIENFDEDESRRYIDMFREFEIYCEINQYKKGEGAAMFFCLVSFLQNKTILSRNDKNYMNNFYNNLKMVADTNRICPNSVLKG